MVNLSSNPEQRRTNRDEGLQLLFGAAMDVARQQGKLGDGVVASEARSALERGRFKLRNAQDHLIAAIPVQDARDMLAYRRELAREVMDQVGVHVNDLNPATVERWKIRIQKPEVRALAWAISTGKRVPYRKRLRHGRLIAILLLLCAVLPGLIYLVWMRRREKTYQRELTALVKRWRSAGQPEPLSSFFRLYGH